MQNTGRAAEVVTDDEQDRVARLAGVLDASVHGTDELLPLVLHELRGLARLFLRGERPGHSLQPTELVNEAYLRLIADQAREWSSPAEIVGVTAQVMRRVLIDHARRKGAAKRGNQAVPLQLNEQLDGHGRMTDPDELLALDSALTELERINPRHRKVVELRFFGGFSVEETATALRVSEPTVKRDWLAARAWLKHQVRSTASQ